MKSKCGLILLVEDDQSIREEVETILNDEGHEVQSVKNGKEALDFLLSCPQENLPHCIILDLMMPVMTGREFLVELINRHDEKLLAIPVIVATAKGSPGKDLDELPGTIQQIRKPFDLDELLESIMNHCGRP